MATGDRADKGRWRRRRDATTKKATKARARAAAQPYLTGEKVRRYESPQMIAKHGRAPWPAKKAAGEAYRDVMRVADVGDKYPTYSLWRHRASKGQGKKATSRGGTWTLRKANVGRAKNGRFKKRSG